jgi:hypothetical protein
VLDGPVIRDPNARQRPRLSRYSPILKNPSRQPDSLDDVSTTSLSLASDKGGTLADPPQSLTEVLGSAHEGGVEGSLVDVVLRNFKNRTLVSILMRMIVGVGEVILTTSSAMVKTSDSERTNQI